MNVQDAVDLLDDELGSGSDPIRWRGEDCAPTDLRDSEVAHLDAGKVRISYYALSKGSRRLRLVKNGTLSGMLKDRARDYTGPLEAAGSVPFPRRAEGRPCPTCGRR